MTASDLPPRLDQSLAGQTFPDTPFDKQAQGVAAFLTMGRNLTDAMVQAQTDALLERELHAALHELQARIHQGRGHAQRRKVRDRARKGRETQRDDSAAAGALEARDVVGEQGAADEEPALDEDEEGLAAEERGDAAVFLGFCGFRRWAALSLSLAGAAHGSGGKRRPRHNR